MAGKGKGGDDKGTTIIKKIKKGGDGGHHGGAWKVAYADFVTAMMAFFLLLWLLSSTTEEQRNGIADYFDPVAVSSSESGSGGILGGMSPTEPGAQISNSMPRATVTTEAGVAQMKDDEEADSPGSTDSEFDNAETTPSEKVDLKKVEDEKLNKEVQEREEKMFKDAKQEIIKAIESDPNLSALAKNLIIDETPEGMRIQITDSDGKAMFPISSAQMYPPMRAILDKVTRVIKTMPNKVSVRGHTDSTPFRNPDGFDNWDLSTDRANASRRYLVLGGLNSQRIASVVGRADSEHMIKDDPNSPQNRRISIILLREKQ